MICKPAWKMKADRLREFAETSKEILSFILSVKKFKKKSQPVCFEQEQENYDMKLYIVKTEYGGSIYLEHDSVQ